MGLFERNDTKAASERIAHRAARREAVANLNEAQGALNANSDRERQAGIRDETPEYHVLNAAADEAHKNPDLPWHRRG